MSKFYIVLFYILISCSVSGQKQVIKNFKMPIYPSCDKLKIEDERLDCFQSNVTSLYTKQLEKYINLFEYLNIAEGEANVILELNNRGEFDLRRIESNSSLFKGYCELAFEEFKNELKNKRIDIIPAKSIDGKENLSIVVSFPIGFKLKKQVEETKNRLIAVLSDKTTEYNIYITPDKEIKIYEFNEFKPIYLGKYNSLQELENTQPYKDLIEKNNDLITLAEADFGKVKLLLKVLNVFKEDEFYTLFIVSELKGRKEKQLRKFTSFDEFKNSAYYEWLIID